MSNKDDRYQYQSWYVKLWRRRHYISIPFKAISWWFNDIGHGEGWSFKTCWSVATGTAQGKMNWVYDWEEIKERFKEDL